MSRSSMAIECREVKWGSRAQILALRDIANGELKNGSGRLIAIYALTGSPDARIVVAYEKGRAVGASSFREVDETIQRINTGVMKKRNGIGRALVLHVAKLVPGKPMWTKSVPSANKFCEALGMKRIMPLAPGILYFGHVHGD